MKNRHPGSSPTRDQKQVAGLAQCYAGDTLTGVHLMTGISQLWEPVASIDVLQK
jgi:hypothetical protein